jgi:hypothetical protein
MVLRSGTFEKSIREGDLNVFFFFCDDCGDKICKKEESNGTKD